MVRVNLIILLLLIFCKGQVFATHIVGGEFELVHKDGYNYELRLIQYFDHIHGNPGAEDQFITAYIFRKRDNTSVAFVNLSRIKSEFVPYTNPECRIGNVDLQTRRITYSNTIYLSPENFGDPGGYYVVWERCCRNGIINNIRDPESTGQTFYLEFPPVTKGRRPFVNSSPILFPPLNDYAVKDQLYYVDFGGTDPDGDSLAYSLAVPLRGNSSPEMPVPFGVPAPYRLVSWVSGYNITNVIPGQIPLNIDAKGFITVKPDRTGLFVFSVKCEEYRNGEKIGEVRRDFQLLVVDVKVGSKPNIMVKVFGKEGFYNENEVLKYSAQDEKCFELLVTDPNVNDKIKIKAVPVNFSDGLEGLLSNKEGIIKNANDTIKSEVCLPDCSYTPGIPFMIDFIAMDNSCALPLMDTIRVSILIEPEKNNRPDFIDPLTEVVVANVPSGDLYELLISGRDIDNDILDIEVVPVGFELSDYGMNLDVLENERGAIDAVFQFDANCEKYDFNQKSNFSIFFKLYDKGDCKAIEYDEMRLDIKVVFPPENPPVISTDLTQLMIDMHPDDSLVFNVFGEDKDDDMINLVGFGADFDIEDYGMSFENQQGNGNLSSTFTWVATCANLQNKDNFLLHFVVDDRGKCKESNFDTLFVLINLIVPDNEAPIASIDGLSLPEASILIGNELVLDIEGFDADNDSIMLKLENEDEYANLAYEFSRANGKGKVNSKFKLTPGCDLLDELSGPPTLKFNFVVTDLRCLNAKSDTISLTVYVEDSLYNYEDFLPYNVFSPNDDDVNDYYEIPNLPPDNCNNQFLGISIFNRWGKLVYYNSRRDFRWDGNGYSTGVYYYVLKYTNKEYKGTVSVLY